MSRNSHSKTRHGCLQCKRRRVRCDIAKPVCSHCIRRQETCEYVIAQQPLEPSKTRRCWDRATVLAGVDTDHRDMGKSPPARAVYAKQCLSSNESSNRAHYSCDLNLLQLTLLQNWHSEAAVTMALDDSLPRIAIWTRVVPALAIDHDFLMHGLLAVSAAHLARTRPNHRDRYLPIAHEHYDRGLELCQELDRAGTPSTNAHSLLEAKITFKLMQVVLSLALTEPTRDADRDLDNFTDWLVLLRSSFRTAHQLYEDLLGNRECRITALLRRAEDGPPELSRLGEGLEKSLDLLDARNRTSNDDTSAIDKEHISDAIAKTKLWMRLVSPRPRTALFVATCAMNLGDDFFRLVKQRNPEALMIMAHFLVPMCHMPKRWFLDGWFDAIIAIIVKMLPVEDWKVHLTWVLGQVDISHISFDLTAKTLLRTTI